MTYLQHTFFDQIYFLLVTDEMPYIKCEAVYGEGGDDDDDSKYLALP